MFPLSSTISTSPETSKPVVVVVVVVVVAVVAVVARHHKPSDVFCSLLPGPLRQQLPLCQRYPAGDCSHS